MKKPRLLYSKSSSFYLQTKNNFFESNNHLLEQARGQNRLYAKQPTRTFCKICQAELPSTPDFSSHEVAYVICCGCGHVNGMFDDSQEFVEKLYIQVDGERYAKNYLDSNYVDRTSSIYSPKLDFLLKNIPPSTDIRLLDVGCGAGYFVYAGLLQGLKVSGIDVSRTMVDFGNDQISRLHKQAPLLHVSESDFFTHIAESSASVISAVGVIEHLRKPLDFFKAFSQSKARFLFYSVPMFSFSAFVENVFPNVFPRQLSGGHTHLFTDESITWLHKNTNLNSLAEWRFGTDMMDLYRSMRVNLSANGGSNRLLSLFDKNFVGAIDQLQAELDKRHFCSEIHCLLSKP